MKYSQEAQMMGNYTIQLDDETGLFLTLHLFANVRNTRELRQKVIGGELTCCVIKAALVVDPFQVVVAANKAALNEKFNRLTTKTLYTELLFSLSTSKNISRSLAEFGIHDADKNILVAIIHKGNDEESQSQTIVDQIEGERLEITKLSEIVNHDLVKKTYKIENEELKVSQMVDSVVSRISCKDFAQMK